MKPKNEEQFEKLLRMLPKFERSAQAEAKFLKKLEALAEKKQLEGALEAEEKNSWFAWPKLAFAGSFAAFIFIVGGTFAAYQPSITRGSLLYPWKQAAERVELAFAFTPLQKVDAHVRFSDRRLEEAQNIVAENPSLAWLVEKASAHEEEIHLDSQEAIYLAATLADMRLEVSLAAEVIKAKISVPGQAEMALEKIEKAVERHVEVLTKMEEKGSKEVKAIVEKIADAEDEHLAIFVEAKEKVKAAMIRKEKEIKVKFEKLEENLKEKRTNRKDEAKEEFIEAVRVFQKLPKEQKEHLKEQLEHAKEAFEEGKFGRTKGLSRALQNELKMPDPGFKPLPKVPDPGFKPLPEEEEINIYNNPKLSPPKPKEPGEIENPDEFIMEIEKVKDSEGIFEKDRDINEEYINRKHIEKIFEKMPSEMEFKWKNFQESFSISQ